MVKKEVTAYSQKTFESIKHIDENGTEFWYARELHWTTNEVQQVSFSNWPFRVNVFEL